MEDEKALRNKLRRIDGKGYKAYNDIRGKYKIRDFEIAVEYVQGDPFASPSRLSIKLNQSSAKFPYELFSNKVRKRALEDFITRKFGDNIKRDSSQKGSGKSGKISMVNFGQAVLERTSCEVNKDHVRVVFNVGLPARGRKILGREAEEIIVKNIPEIGDRSLRYESFNGNKVKKHIETVEDSDFIRNKLRENGLIGFVGNGSILPRESGVGDKPMKEEEVIKFKSPGSLEVEFNTPNGGKINGMGIKEGINLIVGGGYHGKSTLLNALTQGVYDHIPDDGREFVVSRYESSIIRAEDGRFVKNVNISPFIYKLPSGKDTCKFSSDDASGSTSQATNIIESLEAGADVLMIDEDTSATNFMIRDERMQELIAKEKEPITPLIDKIRLLYDEKGVSTILVMGGSGDYFEIADNVIMMDEYTPKDVTDKAKEVSEHHHMRRKKEGGGHFGMISDRRPVPKSIDPLVGKGKAKIKSQGMEKIQFGREDIDLSKVHQLTESPQCNAIGDVLYYLGNNVFDGNITLKEGLDKVEEKIKNEGLRSVMRGGSGSNSFPRRFEVAAALNRLRSLNTR